MRKSFLQSVDEFARGIEGDVRRLAGAIRVQFEAQVIRQDVGIGSNDQQVGCCFDGGEAGAGDLDGSGIGEALDGGTHGGFQLEHGGGGGVAGVGCFFIDDDGEWDESIEAEQLVAQAVQPDPQVIGIEELVAIDVLKRLFIGGRALGAFAEQQATVVAAAGEVPAFAIGGGAAGHFHGEGLTGLGEPGQQCFVEGGPEVIGIGNKGIAHALGQQPVQPAAAQQAGINIAMSRWTPFQIRLGRPA